MRPSLALLALVWLTACHRPRADEPNPGAEAQARTAAKTLADIQAAEAASQGPAPAIAPIVHRDEPKAEPAAPESKATPTDDATTVAVNDAG